MRILIVKLSSLGDLFHALPAVHNLRTGLGADIDWVVTDTYLELARCFADVDRAIPFYRNAFFPRLRPFLRELRRCDYDLVLDLQGLLKSAMVARLAKGERVIGPSFRREGTRVLYSEVAGHVDKSRHAVDEIYDVVDYLGVARVAPRFPVDFPETALDLPRPRVAISPASRWDTKNWPTERFADVGRHLQQTHGASVLLLGADEDVAACAAIEKGLSGSVLNLAGATTLAEAGGHLQGSDILICNDSGLSHMAVAVGTPTVAVFGPTNPERTGPYGSGHRVAIADVPCRPCYGRKCRRNDASCVERVTTDNVISLAEELLHASG